MKKNYFRGKEAIIALALALLAGSILSGKSQPVPPSNWTAHHPLIVRGMFLGPPRKGIPFIRYPIASDNKGKGGGGRGGGTLSPAPGYSPNDIYHAYNYPYILSGNTINGAGQTIALVDAYADPYINSDLSAFDSYFGLPAPPSFKILQPQGKPTNNSGWAEEESIDVEWAHAMAPGANIILVEAKSASFSNLLSAVQSAVKAGATVVSMSWGGSEFSSESSFDSYFKANGVSFIASSGDTHVVDWPASSPNVVGVGGTTLTMSSGTTVTGETAWSDSGGGISQYEAEPTWQSTFAINSPAYAGTLAIANGKREAPDVSYDANPNTGFPALYGGRWYLFGGTSCGAPQWAAITALANQKLTAKLIGSLAPELYGLAGANYATYFRDILTSGTGYDTYTGLGSPNVNNLLSGL